MIPSVSIGPRTLLNDCNHSSTAIFWRSATSRLYPYLNTIIVSDYIPTSLPGRAIRARERRHWVLGGRQVRRDIHIRWVRPKRRGPGGSPPFLLTVVWRTIRKFVSHFADIASGPSRVPERFLPGRARFPLVAATCLPMNLAMVGLWKEWWTAFYRNSAGPRSLIILYIPVSWLSYVGYGSDIILQFLSDGIDTSSPLFLIMHLGYASPARIQSGYGYNAWVFSSWIYPWQPLDAKYLHARKSSTSFASRPAGATSRNTAISFCASGKRAKPPASSSRGRCSTLRLPRRRRWRERKPWLRPARTTLTQGRTPRTPPSRGFAAENRDDRLSRRGYSCLLPGWEGGDGSPPKATCAWARGAADTGRPTNACTREPIGRHSGQVVSCRQGPLLRLVSEAMANFRTGKAASVAGRAFQNLWQARAFRRGELRPSLTVILASYDTKLVAPSSQPLSPPAAIPVGKGRSRAVRGGPGWRSATLTGERGARGGGGNAQVSAKGPASGLPRASSPDHGAGMSGKLDAAATAAALRDFLPPTRRGVDLTKPNEGSAARVGSAAGSSQLGAVHRKLFGVEAGRMDDQADKRDSIVPVKVVLSGGAAKAAAALDKSAASLAAAATQRQSLWDSEKQVPTVAATADGVRPPASLASVPCAVVAACPPSRHHHAGIKHEEETRCKSQWQDKRATRFTCVWCEYALLVWSRSHACIRRWVS